MIELKYLETIILCGGQGSRLGELTSNNQKCILEVNGKPFLQYVINQLKSFGLNKFIFSTGKYSEEVEKIFSSIGIISKEDSPLGTGGAIKLASKYIKNDYFMVVNGDSYCNLSKDDFNRFINSYNSRPLIMSTHIDNSVLSSKFKTNKNKYYGAGFYLFPIISFRNIAYRCSLEHDCLPKFLNKEYFFLKDNWLIDIGIEDNLEKAKELLR
jgi:D-glycero-alpha-D-manno-heptose 1-phosphate guanylyltransferase